MTADTVIPYQDSTQSWSRFSYCRNNPIIYKDPTGHKDEPDFDFKDTTEVKTDIVHKASKSGGERNIRQINPLWGGHTDYRVMKITNVVDKESGQKQDVTLVMQRPKGKEDADWKVTSMTKSPLFTEDEKGNRTVVKDSIGYTGTFDEGKSARVRVWVGWRAGENSGQKESTRDAKYYEEYDLISGKALDHYVPANKGSWKSGGGVAHEGSLNDALKENYPHETPGYSGPGPDHDYKYTPRGKFNIESK